MRNDREEPLFPGPWYGRSEERWGMRDKAGHAGKNYGFFCVASKGAWASRARGIC